VWFAQSQTAMPGSSGQGDEHEHASVASLMADLDASREALSRSQVSAPTVLSSQVGGSQAGHLTPLFT
jgi:hypothetical protein